jgi:hypothetical protein
VPRAARLGKLPSLHVAWAAWCATAIVITTRSRWRHLAWLYPAATTLVVLASANHFLLDAAGGLAVTGLGMLAASRPGRPASPGRRHALRTWAPPRASSPGRPASDRPAPRRPGCARRRALAAGHGIRDAAATGRHTAIECSARSSARAQRPAAARPPNTAAGRVAARTSGRVRSASRRGRPGAEAGQPPVTNPSDRPGRGASPFPDLPQVASPPRAWARTS